MNPKALAALLLIASGCARNLPPPPVRVQPPVDLSEAERRYLEGDFPAAENGFRRAANTGDAEAAGWQARCLMQMERFPEAERAFRQVLQARPRDAYALSGMADALLAQGQARAAASAYDDLLADPLALARLDPASVTYRAGIACLRAGLWEDAASRFRRLEKAWPRNPHAVLARERLDDVLLRRFSVQLGVFSTREAADRMAARLLAGGISTQLLPVQRGGATFHAVRVGRFASWAEAQDEVQRLRALGEEGVVVP